MCQTYFILFHTAGPTNTNVMPSPGADGYIRLNIGQNITCESQANPEPEFYWMKVDGSGIETRLNGSVLTMTKDMTGLNEYSCIATNCVDLPAELLDSTCADKRSETVTAKFITGEVAFLNDRD